MAAIINESSSNSGEQKAVLVNKINAGCRISAAILLKRLDGLITIGDDR